MTATIDFNGTNILTSAYMPRFVKHETVTDRLITALQLAREDGEIIVSDKRGKKTVQLQGVLVADNQPDLEAAIDAFNLLLSLEQGNLDISWNGSTRRYIATCTKHTYDRDYYNTNAVPWTAEFTIYGGLGMDTTTTTALNAHTVFTTTPGADSFTMNGSYPSKPMITVAGFNFPSTACGIQYTDTDTGETIVANWSSALGLNDQFQIDCAGKTVGYSNNGGTSYTQVPFFGVFPRFKNGTNNVQISVGSLTCQSSSEAASGIAFATTTAFSADTDYFAQSFSTLYTDPTFQAVVLGMYVLGTPGNVTVRIETDSNGAPSGTLADTNATATLASTAVPTTTGYVTFAFPNPFTLDANTLYWIVVKAASTIDGSNTYNLGISSPYSRGSWSISTNSGSSYSNFLPPPISMCFKVLYGGLGGTSGVKHSVVYTANYL